MTEPAGILRRFNDAGVAAFVWRIETLRSGGTAEIDDAFVTDPAMTLPVLPEVTIDRPAFKTKRDAGAYLSERTRAARATYGDDDCGLWTWLSAWHWNAVCPVQTTGKRKVLAPYNYVFGHISERRKTQHLIGVAVRFFESAPRSRLLLDTPIHSLTAVVEQVSTRIGMTRIRGFFDLLDLLYINPATGRAKLGLVDGRTTRQGDLRHRLPARIRQLEVTHDLTDLTAEQLLGLLGDEFRQWATPTLSPATTDSLPQRRRTSSPSASGPASASRQPSVVPSAGDRPS